MKVRFFAQLQGVAGVAEYSLPLEGTMRAAGLWACLEERFPDLAAWRGSTRLARNCEYISMEEEVRDADEIALIPPVSGG